MTLQLGYCSGLLGEPGFWIPLGCRQHSWRDQHLGKPVESVARQEGYRLQNPWHLNQHHALSPRNMLPVTKIRENVKKVVAWLLMQVDPA